jgi:hypothetical protein
MGNLVLDVLNCPGKETQFGRGIKCRKQQLYAFTGNFFNQFTI